MPERIYKLQPNRTLALRGFDDLGASAAIHSATASSFKVSGIFRDPADFAVLILHDADNSYEHPRLKYLPDFDFSGLTLSFDLAVEGLMPIDSPKFSTIDWPYLDVTRRDGSGAKIRLSEHAVLVAAGHAKATAEFLIQDNEAREFDRLTIWYQNFAFDYIVPKADCTFTFIGEGAGHAHTVTVAGAPFTYIQQAGDTNTTVAQGVVNALAGCPDVTAVRGDGSAELGPPNQVNIRAQRTDGSPLPVVSGATTHTLHGVSAAIAAQELAAQVNSTNWLAAGALIALQAAAIGARLVLTAEKAGIDGNMLSMYAVSKNDRLRTSAETVAFSGGASGGTWKVTLDFSALAIPDVRLMWLTFAPPLANASAFAATEWQATFTNWILSGPESRRTLSVAAPGSVRVEENDSWCTYTGEWSIESGFFSDGFAKRASAIGDSVTVKYSCSSTHDVYLGTSLYTDRGTVGVRLNGDVETELSCFLQNEPSVNTRRKVRSNVPAGEHSVTIRLKTAGAFYFDFLEAAIAGDVPDSLPARPNVSPALDYSTDHTYKLSPARLIWMFDRLGFTGAMNEYIGVFWWNQRRREGATIPQLQVTFNGQFVQNDQVFLDIGGQVCGKTVFPNETNAIIARHFAQFINSSYVGVWAEASGNVLMIYARSPKPAYQYAFTHSIVAVTGSSGGLAVNGSLTGGVAGKWVVDPTQNPAVNRGARDWHLDMFRECKSRGREIVIATSMELVNPPPGFGAIYYDGNIVETDVGFGSLKSTHCAFVTAMADYQKSVYLTLADLMNAAGLTPNLQLGEFLWWFFTNYRADNTAGGMALYHPEIAAAAQAHLGRPLVRFSQPTDDPGVNGGADANFLRARLRDHANAIITYVRGQYPAAKFELLFPYDVNHPVPAGIHSLGGRLNRYINFPVEWEAKAGSNLDRIKMEALDFGAWCRNLDLARTAIEFPLTLNWPRDSIRHLVPVFRGGYAWEKELAIAAGVGIQSINLWAFDHVCIYGWPPSPESTGRSSRF